MLHWIILALGPVIAFSVTLSQLETDLRRQPGNLRLRQKIAKKHEEKKDIDKVIHFLAPYSNEISSDSLRRLARSYREKEDYSNEIQTLELYRQREPDKFRPHYLLGVALKDNKQYDEAVTFLRDSLTYAPKHRPSYETLLEIFETKGQNYESRILLNDMIKRFGDKKEYLNKLCALFVEDGYLAEANKICKKAVKLDPRYPDNHVHLAQTLQLQEKPKAAEKIFITAARQFPKIEFVQWATGEYYFQEKNYPIAIRYLKVALKADKNSARSHLGLALSLFEVKKLDEAIPHYVFACKNDKSQVARKAFVKAAAILRQEIHPKSVLYEQKLGQCY